MKRAFVEGGGEMTVAQAQKIVQTSLFYEVPFGMKLGAQIALFRIYGIVCEYRPFWILEISSFTLTFNQPTVSTLLMKTGHWKCAESISRRLTDVSYNKSDCQWILLLFNFRRVSLSQVGLARHCPSTTTGASWMDFKAL
jgi:hypothetical protein